MAEIDHQEKSSDENDTGADVPDSIIAEASPYDGTGDEILDEDQQKAFQSIMAQVEGSNTEKTASDPLKSASTDPKPGETSEDQSEIAAGLTINEADEDTQDISDDIGDILKEITDSDDESLLPETTADEPVTAPVSDDALEKTVVDDDIVAQNKENAGPAQEDIIQASPPAGNKAKHSEPEEKLPEKDQPDHKHADKKPIPVSLKTAQKAKPLREAPKSTGGRKKKAILISAVVMLFLALACYFYWAPEGAVDSKAPSGAAKTNSTGDIVETAPASQPQEPVAVAYGPSDESRLKMAAEKLDRLRNELIEKKAAIEELRFYYQAGIDAEIRDIVKTVRETGKGAITFKSAMANPRISLGLAAIQRRDTYTKKLEAPVNTLFWNSEALLFFFRKAGLLALMAVKTSDIDIDGFIKQTDEILEVNRSALAQLNIDAVPASPLALEPIWQDIEKRLVTTPVKREKNNTATKTDNAAIWKNICEGDFTRKHRLTALSPEAARCLATWKGKDLFLNELTDMSPEAARQMAAWEGDWLGLNGLKDLPPEAAMHLSRWKGKGLSLNGLSRLSPRVVAILSEWQGDQIELVNVKHIAHWKNPKTRLFLSEALSETPQGNKP
ncbi:MAG: hypothetical protein HGJ94_20675 [Desulfosarcina sp.]|nr:hypothetical protein [Desulfosarcina sp.]MBC2741931.1 hypothetical protein [Desulfosarcina sp.]MBC2764844.1 hypothetical protein [Desulfosarcina sp.]